MASKQKPKKATEAQKKKAPEKKVMKNGPSKQGSVKEQQKVGAKPITKVSQKLMKMDEEPEDMIEKGAMQDEIILVVTFVISILLFLSNLNLGGTLGNFVSGVIFGLIGLEAYLFPIALFLLIAFHVSNYGNRRAGRKILMILVLFIAVASLIELIANGYSGEKPFSKYFMDSFHYKNGGGIIGGIFVMLLAGLFDKVATYVILIAIILISIIVITGKAIFTYVAQLGMNSIEERKGYQRLKREEQEEDELDYDPRKAHLGTDRRATEDRSQRRPAKTFVIDNTIGQEIKKSKDDDNQANPDFDYLFPMAEEETTKKSNRTYEDELHDKFGHGDLDIAEIPDTIPARRSPSREEYPMKDSYSTGFDEEDEMDEFDQFKYHDREDDVEDHGVMKSTSTQKDKTEDNHKKEGATKVLDSDMADIEITPIDEEKKYVFPPIDLLSGPKTKPGNSAAQERELKETALKLQSTLESFGVRVTITNVSCGPAVTRYELQPEQGVKVSKITSLADDIKLNLAAADVRIEAPIPGKAAVGIEVPNKENSMVTFKELIDSKEFAGHASDLAFGVGKDIGGQTVITDIAKMPHLLIAGATGSGKSVCINTLVMSILYKSDPSDVRVIMIDPKVVELNVYNGIPHLLIPVVTDPKKASAALNWAVMEMTERYNKFAEVGARDLKGYNEKAATVAHLKDEKYQKLPQIVIIIDELADLMMVAPGEVEDSICRLAQMARAAGLHLIIATQRPSVNVITGLIKANIPSRIAFAVSSAIDSRTIIDGSGAEKLLGKGDMLFFPSGYPKPVRIQGAFVSDKEVASVVEFLKVNNGNSGYSDDINDKITNAKAPDGGGGAASGGDDRDDYFIEAAKFIIEKDKASIGMLQRVYKIGFNRAARIMDQLAEAGVVGPEEGTKPRKIMMSLEQFENYLEEI